MENAQGLLNWDLDALCFFERNDRTVRNLESPRFATELNDKTSQWEIIIEFPKNMPDSTAGHREIEESINFHLCLISAGQSEVKALIDISITNPEAKDSITWLLSTPHYFIPRNGNRVDYSESRITKNILKKTLLGSELNGIKLDVKINIKCRVIELGNHITYLRKRKHPCADSQYINDYKRLFESKDLTDVIICVGDEEVLAHKIVLIARSAVFAALFRNTAKEQEGRINICDLDPLIFKLVLEYMYTNYTTITEDVVYDLLGAAEMYQLDHLKEMCGDFLSKIISIEMAVATLILADRYHCTKLLAHTKNFIREHRVGVMMTPEFKELLKESNWPLLKATMD